MILNVVNLSFLVYPLVGVGAVTIQMPVAIRSSTVREQNGNLVKGISSMSPEVPDHVRITQVGLRVSLLGVKEVRELNRILNEEYRCVIANHIIVAFFSVEFDGKTSRISNAIGRSGFSGHS